MRLAIFDITMEAGNLQSLTCPIHVSCAHLAGFGARMDVHPAVRLHF